MEEHLFQSKRFREALMNVIGITAMKRLSIKMEDFNTELKPQSQPEIKAQAESRDKAKTEAKPGAKLEIKAQAGLEIKPETKFEIKPESKPLAKVEAKLSQSNQGIKPANTVPNSIHSSLDKGFQLSLSIGKKMWVNSKLVITIFLQNQTNFVWKKGWLVDTQMESDVFPADVGLTADVGINQTTELQFTFMAKENMCLYNVGRHKFIFSFKHKTKIIDVLFTVFIDVLE